MLIVLENFGFFYKKFMDKMNDDKGISSIKTSSPIPIKHYEQH
jgi:hypothetical protein